VRIATAMIDRTDPWLKLEHRRELVVNWRRAAD
jgi:hypothetical protein